MASEPAFTCFPNLPVEIQIKIWHHSLLGPRIIQVARRDGGDRSFSFNGAQPPAALHACQTSREVACSVFKTAFALQNSRPNEPLPPIYIDFAHDTIFLTTPCSVWDAPYEALAEAFPDAQKIQSLAVVVSPSCDIETAVMSIMKPYFTLEKYLGDLRGKVESDLRELVFIVGNQSGLLYDSEYPENVRFSEPEATPQLPWQAWGDVWGDVEDFWVKELSDGWERGVVRFKEVKMV
ncbi:hypothetical protein BKA65DRAFT_519676 [Rhexocercosporidium sp. MPI-PUGE-AT-0058]|nr:hypothetical protein BKA65DRAFT_519676 [Rhexocercosporidium sp. MPI-PUGE-AT-0058]